MNIIGKFKNGTITISNLKTEDDEYKCHFNFDINILTPYISYTYHFGETVYFSMYDFIDGKKEKLLDENCIDNCLEMTKEFFAIKINQEEVNSSIQLNFDKFEDQDKLSDFLIELKAYCEFLIQS